MSKFFEITCRLGGADDRLFVSVVNQGIDAHLEAFTASQFSEKDGRRILNFARSEIPILLRRLRELDDAEASAWADDIEGVLADEKI